MQQYEKRNLGSRTELGNLISGLDEDTIALQYQYIKRNSHPLGKKDELLDPIDGSQYGEWHSRYHPFLRDFQKRFGFYDLFLVGAESGRIVYSVFKGLDFATSLIDGPCAKTGSFRLCPCTR